MQLISSISFWTNIFLSNKVRKNIEKFSYSVTARQSNLSRVLFSISLKLSLHCTLLELSNAVFRYATRAYTPSYMRARTLFGSTSLHLLPERREEKTCHGMTTFFRIFESILKKEHVDFKEDQNVSSSSLWIRI